jgi:hypothetical protein
MRELEAKLYTFTNSSLYFRMEVWFGPRAVLNMAEEQRHLPHHESILAAGKLEAWIRDLYGGGIYEKQQKKPINCILNINKKFN